MTDVTGVVQGGTLAILGAVITQIFTHKLSAKREHLNHLRKVDADRNALLREKLEEFVDTLILSRNTVLWNLGGFEVAKINENDPFDKAQTIQLLYFPSLINEQSDLIELRIQITAFITAELQDKQHNATHLIDREEAERLATEFIKAHNRVMQGVIEIATRLA